GFLDLRGHDLEVEPLFKESASTTPDAALAADALESSGDVVGALGYRLATGDAAGAARLLDSRDNDLRLNALPSDAEGWVATAGEKAPALISRLQALRTDLEASHRATVMLPGFSAAERTASWKRLAGIAIAVATWAAAWLIPLPDGLSRPGLVALGAILATVPLLVTAALPDFAVALALVLALVIPGVVTPEQALAGFASPSWIMMLTLFATGAAVARSGLLYRLALLSLERLPANFFAQSAVLTTVGLGLSAGVTSPSTRVALGVPIARGISDALSYGKRSGGSAAIGLLTFFVTCQLETLFLTGVFTNLVVHGLMPPAARAEVTWTFWLAAALAPHALLFAAYYTAIVLRFRPHRAGGADLGAIRLQRRILGKPAREEFFAAAVLVALVAGFATRSLHGVEPAWIAVGVFLALFFARILDRTALQNSAILGVLVYLGVIMGLGGIFASLGIDSWLASAIGRSLPSAVRNPFVFVGAVASAAFLLRFFVPWSTATSLLALAAIPVAQSLGIHPFVPVITALVAGDHTFLPYVNQAYAIVYFAADGELFSHEQARPMLFLEAGLRFAALLASVPVWKAMKLL
ncbi:MAG: di-/tricarboxylate, partial [Planctomycetota bacterium]